MLAGAFMMIPKKILDATGAFDESFFMYGEDIDLSYRIKKPDIKIIILPKPALFILKEKAQKKEALIM